MIVLQYFRFIKHDSTNQRLRCQQHLRWNGRHSSSSRRGGMASTTQTRAQKNTKHNQIYCTTNHTTNFQIVKAHFLTRTNHSKTSMLTKEKGEREKSRMDDWTKKELGWGSPRLPGKSRMSRILRATGMKSQKRVPTFSNNALGKDFCGSKGKYKMEF